MEMVIQPLPIYPVITKVTWGNSVKMTSERYNFTSTLAIEMYLGKHNAYSILNTHFASALSCCDSSLLR